MSYGIVSRLTAADLSGVYCTELLRVFPGELLDVRVDEVLEAAKAGDPSGSDGKETAIRYPVSQVVAWEARQEARDGICGI